jgi:fatty-acyl-CoA synthase
VKSKKYPFLKQILFTDPDIKAKVGVVLYKDILLYGPYGYYESPLRRIAMNLKADDPVLVIQDNENILKAKSIAFSHKNLINIGQIIGKVTNISQGDRVMIPQHQSSYLGSVLGNFSAFINGAVIVYPAEQWNAKEVLTLLSKEKCTHLFVTESEIRQLLDQPDMKSLDFSSLKGVVLGNYSF